jgi:phage terminase Nu1 subunit (DNA packaging protein)
MTNQTCSLSDFAQIIGRSLPTVRSLVRQGLPTSGRRGRTHIVPIAAGVRWVLALEAERAEAREAAAAAGSLLEAERIKLVREQRRRLELSNRQRAGELVEVASAQKGLDQAALSIRERLITLPTTAVQRGLTEAALIELVDEALSELARVRIPLESHLDDDDDEADAPARR